MKRMTIAATVALVMFVAITVPGAQDLLSSAETLVFGATVLQPNPASTQEELPGMGHKFELLGAMQDDKDPENTTNDVVSIDTNLGIGLAYRNLPPGIKIAALDNQVGLKYYFVAPRSCGGGSPRLDLLIDANGDGKFTQPGDFVAHAHVNAPATIGCPTGEWVYQNFADHTTKWWETTPATATGCGPAGNPFTTCTWDELESRVTLNYPNHKVLAGFLLDGESCGFTTIPDPTRCGKAYYDLVTIENRTLENDQDTVKDGR